MPSRAPVTCQTVLPILARYDDPDLSEAERVLASTHLLRCQDCLTRLQEYRRQARLLRKLDPTTLNPRVHHAIWQRLAAPAEALAIDDAGAGKSRLTLLAVATLVAVVVLFGELAPTSLTERRMGTVGPSVTANDVFAQPLTGTFFAANPTRVITTVADSFSDWNAAGTPTLAMLRLTGTVRVVSALEGLLIVTIAGTGRDERLMLTRDTQVILLDGRHGTLADLGTGGRVQVHCDQTPEGFVVREILVLR